MIELFVNNTLIELQKDALIALTFQAKDIESPSTFQSTFSINFSIPATPKNIKTLGFSNDINVNTNFPYVFQDIRLINFGTEIIPFGALYVLRYTENYRGLGFFECRLFSGSLALFDAIEGKFLSDLDLDAINHNRDIATITASTANDWTDGYTYGITQSGLSGSTVNPSDRDLAPLIFYRYIFEQIITQAGFSIDYRLFEKESLFNEILIHYSNDIQPRLATVYILNEGLDLFAGKTAPQIINTQLGGLTFPDTTTPPFFEGSDNPFNGESYTPTAGQGVVVTVEANILIDATLSGADRKLQLVIFDTIISAERVIAEYDIKDNEIQTIKVNSQVEIGFLSLSTYIRLRVDNTFFNPSDSIEISQQSTLKITVIDSAFVPTLWEVTRHLPKITQKDFLKDAFFRFGLLPQLDQFTNTVKISELDYTASLGFDDWTEKLDFTNESTTQYYPEGWGQTSVYVLKDDDTIEPENTQSYELSISDVKLPSRVEVWSSPFGSNGIFPQSPFLIPEIKRYTIKEGEVDENTTFAGIYSIARYSLYDTTKLSPRLVQRTTDDFPCIVLNSNFFLSSTTITFKALINPEQQFEVQWLANILQQAKKITIDAYLNSLDVFQIDFSKPKYLQQFNSLFYLNAVNQWQGDTKSCELELFKINDVFTPPPPPPPVDRYVLYFDGVNDYLQSQTTASDPLVTNFVAWNVGGGVTEVPLTTFIKFKLDSIVGNRVIFDSRENTAGGARGVLIWMVGNIFSFEYRDGGRLKRFQTSGFVTGVDYVIQATYTGIGNTYGLKVNNMSASVSVVPDSFAPLDIRGSGRFTIGKNQLADSSYYSGQIQEFSVVNYVKSVPEMQADFTAGTQSVGSGAWRVAPIKPIYPDNIKTLNTSDINAVLPNSNAFVNSQGIKTNLLGFPNPLVLNTNLILLP